MNVSALRLTRITRLTAICLVAATLAACSTAPSRPPSSQTAGADGTFERSGRFALTVYDRSAERNRDSVQGGFTWLDTGAVLTLDLTNPLGSTLARVVVADHQAVLTRSNGQRTVASDPDALVAEVLGSPIPVSGMRNWLKGQRNGQAGGQGKDRRAAGQAGAAQGAQAFDEAGWRVNMSDFDSKGPTRLNFERTMAGDRITVRVVTESE
ncbi:MAG TPA: outer membrane lipoprotein LolB [Advenella sp.]|nr:outer membrane lipoprotein LolB [Advenella sp.]